MWGYEQRKNTLQKKLSTIKGLQISSIKTVYKKDVNMFCQENMLWLSLCRTNVFYNKPRFGNTSSPITVREHVVYRATEMLSVT